MQAGQLMDDLCDEIDRLRERESRAQAVVEAARQWTQADDDFSKTPLDSPHHSAIFNRCLTTGDVLRARIAAYDAITPDKT
jgi:site-specific recombinase